MVVEVLTSKVAISTPRELNFNGLIYGIEVYHQKGKYENTYIEHRTHLWYLNFKHP